MIIRSQADISKASDADLHETYQALTGKRCKPFPNRDVAETKVAMAILSAVNASGHLGTPKGTPAKCLTHEERLAKAAEKGLPNEDDLAERRPPEPGPKRPRRALPGRLVATGQGTSRLQPGSSRAAILAFIAEEPRTFEEVLEKFPDDARGGVFKLMEKGHVKED
jgi:hypothetical protein